MPVHSSTVRPVARTLLFVPGHQPSRFDKACQSGADAVVFDLEDGVPPERKEAARAQVRDWLEKRTEAGENGAGPAIGVRINGADTPWYAEDLALCTPHGAVALMLPKAEDPALLREIAGAMPTLVVWPLIETARGIARLDEIAAAPGVQRLMFGSIDFQADLGIEGEGDELLFYRSRIVLATRLAGLQPPVDGISTAIDDAACIQAEAQRARRMGFGGKLCIHPKQVAVVNQAFLPTPVQIDWAHRVIAADAASGGAPVAVDGKMVDRPVVLNAQALLRAAAR